MSKENNHPCVTKNVGTANFALLWYRKFAGYLNNLNIYDVYDCAVKTKLFTQYVDKVLKINFDIPNECLFIAVFH
jgi:hypothetical protein